MSRVQNTFICRECHGASPKWAGRCPNCASWNSLAESREGANQYRGVVAQPLVDVALGASEMVSTGVTEFDRVLGGGLVSGSTTLLCGEPGIGKSTLALMTLCAQAARGDDVVLVASEESLAQVARRARRLGEISASLAVISTTNVSTAVAAMGSGVATCVIDSVSALRDDDVSGVAGSVAQVRSAAERLCAAAKSSSTALVLVGHVTKDGDIAGPRALEHVVDTVVRVDGDRHESLRVVRALKHRFGPTEEIGLLTMTSSGLVAWEDTAVATISSEPGVVSTVSLSGSRGVLVEVQALVAPASGPPRRVAHHVAAQRLSLMLAVLDARAGISLGAYDVFCATAGGLAATEPAADVAVALAIASAACAVRVAPLTIALGEIGLAGELRSVSDLSRRVREAVRRGARRVIVPSVDDVDVPADVEVVRCAHVRDVLRVCAITPKQSVASVG